MPGAPPSSSSDPRSHPDDVRMTLGEHLEELRTRLIRAMIGLVAGSILCYIFIDHVMGFLTAPLFAVLRSQGIEPRMVALNPAENFLTFLKVSIIVGFIASAPYSLTQIWGFVSAGLYPHERKWVRRFAPASIGLFFVGAGFLLLVVSPMLLNFLVGYRQELPNYDFAPRWLLGGIKPIEVNEHDLAWPTTQPIPAFDKDPTDPPQRMVWINARDRVMRIRLGDEHFTVGHLEPAEKRNRLEPMMRISEYVVFILHLAAAFGIGFQVPVVVSFVAVVGLATADQMARLRRYIWFGMAIGSACITPPDISSMILLLGPMAMLFEVGLLIARAVERRRAANKPQ